jgi:hypothetical protein
MQATITLELNARMAVPFANEPAEGNVLAALVEALSSGEHYELVERDGELFVQPTSKARTVRNPPAFSPDARARQDALAMAA